MLIHIAGVLAAEELGHCRAKLNSADWKDGRHSAGYLSRGVKENVQLADDDPTARELGELILRALDRSELFTAAALPLKIVPPLFNRYEPPQTYGSHIDGAIRPITGTPYKVRTDLSATLFLSEPGEYEGGELVVQESYGEKTVKLAAGDMVLYPGTSVHRVTPVTRGTRLASFFWIESMIRDQTQRTILFQLDNAIQSIGAALPGDPAVVELAGVYHNLLRCWAVT